MAEIMHNEIEYVKLDEDDILEIIVEYFQNQNPDIFFGKGIMLGTPQKNLRFVGVLSTENKFSEARNVDLVDLDQHIEYNGFHAYLKKHPECWIIQGQRDKGTVCVNPNEK